MTHHVLLAGGTGLVGTRLTRLLSAHRDVAPTSLVRTPRSPAEWAIDFEALVADPLEVTGPDRIDVGISCLGTTIRKAGSQTAFHRVDRDYVLAVARAALGKGARQFIMISSVGAGGSGFYLRVKGEVEAALKSLGFPRLDIIRPGLILGERQERRPFEKLAQQVAPLLDPVLVGGLRRYASVSADTVAAAIASLIGKTEPGCHIHQSPELSGLAGQAIRGA
jgi:uncharacterized protein YbjT (DUF2867 family)